MAATAIAARLRGPVPPVKYPSARQISRASRQQRGGVCEPQQLHPLHPASPPKSHAHCPGRCEQSRKDPDEAWQQQPDSGLNVRQRTVRGAVDGREPIGVEHPGQDRRHERRRDEDRERAPAPAWQPTIRKHQCQRRGPGEQGRPVRLIPEQRPSATGQRARIRHERVAGIRLHRECQAKQGGIGDQHPSHCVALATPHDQAPNRERNDDDRSHQQQHPGIVMPHHRQDPRNPEQRHHRHGSGTGDGPSHPLRRSCQSHRTIVTARCACAAYQRGTSRRFGTISSVARDTGQARVLPGKPPPNSTPGRRMR